MDELLIYTNFLLGFNRSTRPGRHARRDGRFRHRRANLVQRGLGRLGTALAGVALRHALVLS